MTGAAGFVGRHVVQSLLTDGHELTLLLRSSSNIPAAFEANPQIDILGFSDADAEETFATAFSGVSAVVHLAGLAHVAKSDRAVSTNLFTQSNTELTARLARLAAANDIKSFIHLSSLAAVVPNACEAKIDDTVDLGPASPYGQSKREAEKHVQSLAETGAFAISLRPPLIVGAEAKGNWASLQALAATGIPLPFASLRNKRSFVGIGTLVKAITLLCTTRQSSENSGEYCLVDPETMSTADVVRELRAGMKMPPRIFPCPTGLFRLIGRLTGRRRQLEGLIGDLEVDASRFYSTFDFSPSQNLGDAMRQSGAAYIAGRPRSRYP